MRVWLRLKILKVKVQAMCYWYNRYHEHAACLAANGSGRLCSFCEIVEALDEILKEEKDVDSRTAS